MALPWWWCLQTISVVGMELCVVYLQGARNLGVGEPVPKYGDEGRFVVAVDIAWHYFGISIRMWE